MTRTIEIQSYADAVAYLARGRDKDDRPLASNTRLQSRPGGSIAVRLYSTDIVTYHPDGRITLRSGGWRTYTTKARINGYAPVWVGSDGAGGWDVSTDTDSAQFINGVTIDADGSLESHKALTFAEGRYEYARERMRDLAPSSDVARAVALIRLGVERLADALAKAQRAADGVGEPEEHECGHLWRGSEHCGPCLTAGIATRR